MVPLIVAISLFTFYEPRHRAIEKPKQPPFPLAYADMQNSVDNSAAYIDWDFALSVPESESLLYQIPYNNGYGPVDQNLSDFNLLLPEDDLVRLSSLFGLGVKTIVIDPGHGGKDPGAIGAKGTKEKNITLDVAIKLKEKLVALSCFNVLLTRENDQTLSLADRVEYAKKNSADLFISIHVNSVPDKKLNLIETYYFGAPQNIQALRLAERENKDSHFTVGELDTIIKDIGNTLKRQESAMLAAEIQKSLFRNLSSLDAQIHNFGIKMAPFVVLSQIEVPSVLVEISCITKAEEEQNLTSIAYREKVATYLKDGIFSYLETQYLRLTKGEDKNE